jgi:excisionase family DNA binding protein
MKQLIKVPEAARRLGLSRTMLYKLIREGVLPCVRIGRTVRVDSSTLDLWVAQQATMTAVPREVTR